MHLQSAIKRSRTNLWQFSIAQLLVLTFLIAIVFAVIRWNPLAGVIASFICIAIILIVIRTRIAIRQQELSWDNLSGPPRRDQSVPLAIWSTLIVFPAMALCLFGIVFTFGIGAIVLDAFRPDSPIVRLHVAKIVFGLIYLGFVPLTLGTVWIWFTWPKLERARC